MFLLDLLRGHPGALAKAQAFDEGEEAASIPVPVLAEFLDGAYSADGRYLTRSTQLVAGRDVVPLDRECGVIAAQVRAALRRQGISLPMIDAMIAAIALRHHSVRVTGDSGFARIPGLAVESY